MTRVLNLVRLFYAVLLLVLLSFVDLLLLGGKRAVLVQTDQIAALQVIIVTTVLAVAGAASLVSAPYLSGKITQLAKQRQDERLCGFASLIRASFFMAVGAYGFVLGLMGALWSVILPFFAASFLALVLTFPTQKRWKRMLE